MIRSAALAAAVAVTVPTAAQAKTPVVYSSLPLHGAGRASALAVQRGAALALREAGSPFRFVSLDDSTRRAGAWTPLREVRNARRAARDHATIGYIGVFNSGAGQIAIPVLNEPGIAVISPSATANGLTVGGPGTTRGEPLKYYPTNVRTFFRLSPSDAVQGGALAAAMSGAGCTRAAVLSDRELYGEGVGAVARSAATMGGIRVVAARAVHRQRNYRALGRALHRAGANCVVYAGITANGAVALFRDVGRALPTAKLFASDGVAEGAFARHIPRGVARRTLVSVSTLAPEAYPADGQRVIARYHDPYAAYGYEAMRLLLDAFRAVGSSRPAVISWLHGVQGRAGAIGTYGFDANGDTTSRTYGLYAIRGGRLTWAGAVTG